MAVIKAVSSKAGIGGAIDYVTKEEKTEERLISGYNCGADSAKEEMEATKELWGKQGGRTYKHFVQSFHEDEKISTEKAHDIAMNLVEESDLFHGFECLVSTHKDKKHVHTHIIVNSVNAMDGHKFQMSAVDLQVLKDLSDKICLENGLTIAEKGMTFHGKEREDTVAYTKEKYQLLQKAEQGEVKSYIQDTALAVMECKDQAVSRADFIAKMQEKGYETNWSDTRKYITFTTADGKKVRNSNLEKTYNLQVGKESLEHEFESNLQREQGRKRTREADHKSVAGRSGTAESIHSQIERRKRESAEIEQERKRTKERELPFIKRDKGLER